MVLFPPHPVCQGILGVWSVASYLLHFILWCWGHLIDFHKIVGHSCSGSIKHGIFLRQKFEQSMLYGGLWVTVLFSVLSYCISFILKRKKKVKESPKSTSTVVIFTFWWMSQFLPSISSWTMPRCVQIIFKSMKLDRSTLYIMMSFKNYMWER